MTVDWAGSAFEHSEWTFSGQFDENGVLEYYNCLKIDTVYDETEDDGIPKEVYEGGTG